VLLYERKSRPPDEYLVEINTGRPVTALTDAIKDVEKSNLELLSLQTQQIPHIPLRHGPSRICVIVPPVMD
jgi:hypothetical protein